MENNTNNILTDTQLIEELNTLATERGTNIETLIKLLMAENNQLKNKPDNYITETKVSRSKNGKGKTYTYSTVIPKPILNKFNLEKGQLLYWDIDENKLIITPEVRPMAVQEEASIQAGTEMLNDWLINNNGKYYINPVETIKNVLTTPNEVQSKEDKVKKLLYNYNDIYRTPEEKEGFKKVVLYLLDYPLNLPNQYEILTEVYEEINKNWLAPILYLELLTIPKKRLQ